MQQTLHKVMQFRKLCIAVEQLTLEGYIFIASINQSIFCHINRISTETQAVWVSHKMCLKAGYMLLKLCHMNDKCAQSARIGTEVIVKSNI